MDQWSQDFVEGRIAMADSLTKHQALQDDAFQLARNDPELKKAVTFVTGTEKSYPSLLS